MSTKLKSLIGASLLAVSLAPPLLPVPALAVDAGQEAQAVQVQYRSAIIDNVNIAYREAGDPARPTVLLLHGFPTSSHMFRNLIPVLAERYHVIAPDYPGFGASAMPDAAAFEYSFANIAQMMTQLLDRKGVGRYAVYLMD